MKLITILTEKPTGLRGTSETHTVKVINPLYVVQLLPLPQDHHATPGTLIRFKDKEIKEIDVLTDIDHTREIIEHALNSPETVQGHPTTSPQLRMREPAK